MKFSEFVSSYPAADPQMHLMHCTSARSSVLALEGRQLSPTWCRVYGEDLLYMFYGRPAYKTSTSDLTSNLPELAPVCLVLDPSVLTKAVRVLPFDSGGFARYEASMGVGYKLSDFEIGLSSPLHLVGAFFETNRKYYDQTPARPSEQIPMSKLTARAYARLIADTSVRDLDDRCGTIEVQFASVVSLKSALRAIVAPAPLLDDPDFQSALADCGSVVPLSYKMYGRNTGLSYAHTIYERIDAFLTDEGVLA